LSKDPVAMTLIESMRILKQSGDPFALAGLMAQVKDPRILRLVNTSVSLRTAMQGSFSDIYRAFDSVRGVLDRRLEIMVLGEDITPKPKTSAAFRAVRTGNIHRLRWLWLVEITDDGTTDKPLLSLQKMTNDAAKLVMATALARACTIVSLSFPEVLAVAALFFPKLHAKLSEYIDLGVAWPALNEWFASIVQCISKPVRRLHSGDGEVNTIVLDVAWFDTPSDFNRKIERAVQIALSSSGARKPKRPRTYDEDDDESVVKKKARGGGKGAGRGAGRAGKGAGRGAGKDAKGKQKSLKAPVESEDEVDPDADDELDDIDDVKPKGGEKDADGLWKVVPKNVGAIITAFAKAHKNKPIAERPCWNRVFKSGGCTKQSCPFSH
jgi:hypothetical protein